MAQPIEIKVNHRCDAQRKNLRQQQSTYNHDAKWPTQFSADTAADGERDSTEQSLHRRHHDRPKAQQRGVTDRHCRQQTLATLGIGREVDHHDGVSNSMSASSAPTPAEGSVDRMVIGWT